MPEEYPGDPRPAGALSLRSRVALAAALGAVVVAVLVATLVAVLLERREVAALDRRLDGVTEAAQTWFRDGTPARPPTTLDGETRPALGQAWAESLVITVRPVDAPPWTVQAGASAPTLPPRTGSTAVDGQEYRLQTAGLPDGGTVTVGFGRDATERTVAGFRRGAALIAVLAAAAAAGLGWLLAGPATRPLRALRDRTAALGGSPGPGERAQLGAGPVARAKETAVLAAAVTGLLDRVDQARTEQGRALQAARDFAAAAGHELRTPLTTMRTDLEVLIAHPHLPDAQRAEVLAQLRSSQARLEAALTALSHLAAGELTGAADRVQVEVTDLTAQAVTAARRLAPPGMTVEAHLPAADVTVPGSPAGLRLALDNLLANALRHSGGTRIEASLSVEGDRVLLAVDDDGAGVPTDERDQVFDRFRRGREATTTGSGLGLALVAQQARLHGGHAYLTDSRLGGARAVLELPRQAPDGCPPDR